jgi:predicted lipid-binding transport protein (Tim44 family)
MPMTSRRLAVAVGLFAMALLVSDAAQVWARAGGGGSRGSRSFSAPSRPSPVVPSTPQIPDRSVTGPAPSSTGQRPGLFGGGFMSGLAGFALGGLLGGLLFGGMRGGIGFLDIVLIGGAVLLLMSFLRRRQAEPAYAGAGGGYGPSPGRESAGTAAISTPVEPADLAQGLAHLRQMDPSFNPESAADVARGMFMEVQAAVQRRDLAAVRERLTTEMFGVLQAQIDKLKGLRQTNIVDGIELRRAVVSEAWQEAGQDYITVCFEASLIDYTIDDAMGTVVEGSRTEPQMITEFWTFTRPVGPNRWKLSAIQPG